MRQCSLLYPVKEEAHCPDGDKQAYERMLED
eukprot:CAMPEP_0170490546 /NCGR_PEP_ID=MMETSP0208-20121228/8714_1 /TAXON_ID=197538 /ORGANISM="Strombidium inclinatum, Strain S3" /LENGTH=30 /DNA_ID= /DNA_START= /DNA_END= /DNA_ORIENTATION=